MSNLNDVKPVKPRLKGFGFKHSAVKILKSIIDVLAEKNVLRNTRIQYRLITSFCYFQQYR